MKKAFLLIIVAVGAWFVFFRKKDETETKKDWFTVDNSIIPSSAGAGSSSGTSATSGTTTGTSSGTSGTSTSDTSGGSTGYTPESHKPADAADITAAPAFSFGTITKSAFIKTTKKAKK